MQAHIAAVDLAEDGVVVTFEDASVAFYHESLFQLHLVGERVVVAGEKKKPGRVRPAERTGSR